MVVITNPTEGSNILATLDAASGEDAWIKLGASLISSDNWALVGAGSGHVVTVDGLVRGATPFGGLGGGGGIDLGDSTGTASGNRLIVHQSGAVMVETFDAQQAPAVVMRSASGQIINEGLIQARAVGGGNATFGLALFLVAGASGIVVQNSGTIIGGAEGIRHYAFFQSTGSKVTLINTGFIGGFFSAYSDAENTLDPDEPAPIDIIINRGTMSGMVRLNHGNDIYDGAAGRVFGTVDGGTGDDRFKPGMSRDVFIGGDGVDTLDFSASSAVSVNLGLPYGPHGFAGAARGDQYLGFENIAGSAKGNDTLIGSAGDNQLRGLGGHDALFGGDGVDRLVGGAGRDRLTGGAGQDQFVFASASEGGDRIVDFSTDALAADVIEISARGFGGGLRVGELAAHQFRARLTNTAVDTSDRFIYRTLDDTLWFDRDGSAKKYAPVLLATFDGDILLSYANFVIV